jgi:hypothetical protein
MDPGLIVWLYIISFGGLVIGGVGSIILFILFALRVVE